MKQISIIYFLQKMTFLNKKTCIAALLVTCSCSNLPNEVYLDALRPIYKKFSRSTLEDFKSEYSSVYVQIGDLEAVLILKEILSDGITYRWAGKDDVFIDTINGKIVKTKGLERNIELIDVNKSFITNSSQGLLFTANFFDPELYSVTGKSITSRELIDGKVVITEVVSYKGINFKAKNKFYLNKSNNTTHTIQKIHPYLEKIRMDFRY